MNYFTSISSIFRLISFYLFVCLTLLVQYSVSSEINTSEDKNEVYQRKFVMPHAEPRKKDDYICTGMVLNRTEEWILKYEPLASADRAHHMLLYGCKHIKRENLRQGAWDCMHHGICEGSKIMYAWAKNAPATNLPNDVGYRISGSSDIKYLALQIHYANPLPEGESDDSGLQLTLTRKPQKYKAGIYLLMRGFLDIPPLTAKTHGDINCVVGKEETDTINVFAFRTHAHSLCSVITGYKYDPQTNELKEFVKGNPQWPQAFYPLEKVMPVRLDEILHARCTYNSTTRNRHTHIGSTAADEMCNLYLMYYTDRVKGKEFGRCGRETYREITEMLPASSDEPLPYNEILEGMTHGKNINKDKVISYDDTLEGSNSSSNSFDASKALAAYKPKEEPKTYFKSFHMPGVTPTTHDSYICTSMALNSTEEWVLRYDPLASANRAHHMLLFGCSDVNQQYKKATHWDCGHHGVCQGGRIMYAWAKNAPSTNLPDGVGFRIGGSTEIKYLVLQIHYANPLPPAIRDTSGLKMQLTTQKQNYMAGIYLLAAGYADIPPHAKKTHADINCQVGTSEPVDINIFAYRVHAHKLGSVITGYKYNPDNGELVEFIKGNPQWPQAFYPTGKIVKVKPTDILHARCTFDSTERDTHTYIGSTSADEMCNLYLMYYTDTVKGVESGGCGSESYPSLTASLPPTSDVPLPPNPEMEELAHGENHNKGKEISYNTVLNNGRPIELEKKTQSRKDPEGRRPIKPKPVELYDDYNSNNVGKVDYFGGGQPSGTTTPQHIEPNLISSPRKGKQLPVNSVYNLVDSWGPSNYKLGQVTAVAVDSRGDVVVFHRGETSWDGSSFGPNNMLNQRTNAIAQPTLLHLSKDNGHVMHEWGANFFFMPHGLSVDHEDNLWLTDVGMHQIFKFPSGYGEGKPLLTLGVKFEPGSDDSHFCKPTAVSVVKSGEFFVADGYCNARIIHYSSTGEIIKKFGEPSSNYGFGFQSAPEGSFKIPHALTIVEDHNEICVADRENGRVQCFNMNSGKFSRLFKFDEWGSRLFAAAYTPHFGGRLLAVNGPSFMAQKKVQIFEVSYTKQKLINAFSPHKQGLSNPHDLTLTEDGTELYVVEIGPNKIWKFSVDSKLSKNSSVNAGTNLEVKTGELQEGSPTKLKLNLDSWTSVGISSVVIGLVAVPILVIILLAAIIRCRNKGSRKRYSDHGKFPNLMKGKGGGGLNLGSLLHKRQGFEQVATNDIDDDDLDSADSDIEEFSLAAAKV